MKKRLLAAALCACLLLSGCGAERTEPLAEEPEADGGTVIAYVPLDDRPDNVERVVYLAESLGYRLEMPEPEDYRTALDGQPKNYDSLQCGNPWSLYTWVLEQEAAGCDRYILFMDQLLSGGLVASRSVTEDQVPIPGGGTTSSRELMDSLLSTLAEDKNNTVWLLDSVMRLAPTVGYEGGTIEAYNALRAYGAEGRPELPDGDIEAADVQALYRLGTDGNALDPADFDLTEDQLTAYLAARSRKLALSERMLQTVQCEGYEHFRVLIGIDDSSEEESIQKNEITYLRSLLRKGDALLSGVDDLAFKAVTRMYLDEIDWAGATVDVTYFGGTEDQPACAYDYKPLTEIVQEHMAFFELVEIESTSAGMKVLVLTQPADEAEKAAYIDALVGKLKEYQEKKMPVILIDASNGRYGTAFHEALTKKTELGQLLSYAGFLDMAIVTGTALSHGVARYAALRTGLAGDTTVDRAFCRTLADSILKDFCYKHIVRNDILAYVRNDLGGSADNFWTPDIDREAVLARLESGMETAMRPVIENLERSNFLTLDWDENGGLVGWGGIAVENYSFPWDRAFEISMDIRLGDFTEPHKQVLGLYTQ